MQYCNCMKVRRLKDAWGDIRDELKELVAVKSVAEFRDEFSDVAWGFGRLIAGQMGRTYVRMPFDRLHYEKVQGRMAKFGCVRSERNLVNGRCPSQS